MSSSFSVMDKHKVLRACERYIEARNGRVEKEKEELIQAEMSRRFFPAKTREKAIERLTRDAFDEFTRIEITGGYYLRMVQDLKSLAQVSDDKVHVGAEVVRTLNGFW